MVQPGARQIRCASTASQRLEHSASGGYTMITDNRVLIVMSMNLPESHTQTDLRAIEDQLAWPF